MSFRALSFAVGNETLAVREYHADSSDWYVLVHGAGSAHQAVLQPLASYIQAKGFNCLSFDFSGHGESSRRQLSSLQTKTKQLHAVLNHYAPKAKRIYLLAFSMGGQVATNVVRQFPNIAGVVLFSPALYDTAAMNIPFDGRFSRAIRKPESWRNNNALDKFQGFDGFLHLVRPECDSVIPEGVFEFYRRCVSAEKFYETILPEANHYLGAWLAKNITDFSQIFNEIKNRN